MNTLEQIAYDQCLSNYNKLSVNEKVYFSLFHQIKYELTSEESLQILSVVSQPFIESHVGVCINSSGTNISISVRSDDLLYHISCDDSKVEIDVFNSITNECILNENHMFIPLLDIFNSRTRETINLILFEENIEHMMKILDEMAPLENTQLDVRINLENITYIRYIF